jgi:hypothetical protein
MWDSSNSAHIIIAEQLGSVCKRCWIALLIAGVCASEQTVRRTNRNIGFPNPICICIPSRLESYYPLGLPYDEGVESCADILRVDYAALAPRALAARQSHGLSGG